MQDTLLWIVPKWPLPPQDGARRATVNLVRALSKLGENIHLVALVNPHEVVDEALAKCELGVVRITTIFLPKSDRSVLRLLKSFLLSPKRPLTFRRFSLKHLRQSMMDVIKGSNASSIVFDGLHCAIPFAENGKFNLKENQKRIIYRAHNREADIWFRKAEHAKNLVLKRFLQFQSTQVARFEDSLAESADVVATVSEDDLKIFKKISSNINGVVVPIGYNFNNSPPFKKSESIDILFIGLLDWRPNKEGLKWFLDNVWPMVSREREDLKLTIVGSGDGRWVETIVKDLKRVTFVGRVEDLQQVYLEAHLCLVPVFYGSGTRVKVIEACCYRRPCISTELGVEGTGLREGIEYLRCEDVDTWISALKEVTYEKLEQLGSSAHDRAKTVFDEDKAALLFRAAL